MLRFLVSMTVVVVMIAAPARMGCVANEEHRKKMRQETEKKWQVKGF